MHGSTRDGRHLFVVDGWGATRLTLPNKVKTERKVMGSDAGAFSVSADDHTVAVWDDLWDQVSLLSVPDMKRQALDRFAHRAAKLQGSGVSLLRVDRGAILVEDPIAKSVRRFPLPPMGAAVAVERLGRDDAGRARVWQTLACAGDRVAVLLEHELMGRLLIGRLEGEAFVREVELILQVGGGGPLQLSLSEERATLLLVEPGIASVFGMHVAFNGRVERWVMPGVTMPERDGSAWVSQISDSTVIRCDEGGTVLDRWEISDRQHHSVGELIVVGGAPWFVPLHREALLSLADGEVVSRKLAPKEQPVRNFYAPKLTRYGRAGAPFGVVFSLGRVSYWNKDTQVSASFTVSAGDGSLGANFVRSALYGECNDGDQSALAPFLRGGTGMGAYSDALIQPITVDAVRKLVEQCDAERIWLPFGFSWLHGLYERRMSKGSLWHGEASGPPGELDAERALFRALLAHCADPSIPPLATKIDSWLGPLSPKEALESLARLDDKAPTMPCRVYEAIAWMLVRVLDPADAATVLVWMLLDGSDAQLNNSTNAVGAALAALLTANPALQESTVELVRAHAPAPRQWGGDRRDDLLQSLTTAPRSQ